jgi:hypothetical protein
MQTNGQQANYFAAELRCFLSLCGLKDILQRQSIYDISFAVPVSG